MKIWNSPAIEVLDINKTENGTAHSLVESCPNFIYRNGSHADSACEMVGLVFGIPCEHDAAQAKGNDVTPNTQDNTSDVADIDRLS